MRKQLFKSAFGLSLVLLMVAGAIGQVPLAAAADSNDGIDTSSAQSTVLSGTFQNRGYVFLMPGINEKLALKGWSNSPGTLSLVNSNGVLTGTAQTVLFDGHSSYADFWPRYYQSGGAPYFYGQYSNDGLNYDQLLWAQWNNNTPDMLANDNYSVAYERNNYTVNMNENLTIPYDQERINEVRLLVNQPGIVTVWWDQSFGDGGNEVNLDKLVNPENNTIGFTSGQVTGNSLARDYHLFYANTTGWYYFMFIFSGGDHVGSFHFRAEMLGTSPLSLDQTQTFTNCNDYPTDQEQQETTFGMYSYSVPVQAFHLYQTQVNLWQTGTGGAKLSIFYPTGQGYQSNAFTLNNPALQRYFGPNLAGASADPITADGNIYLVLTLNNYQKNCMDFSFSTKEIPALNYTLGAETLYNVNAFNRTYVQVQTNESMMVGLTTRQILGAPTLYGPGNQPSLIGEDRYVTGINTPYSNENTIDDTGAVTWTPYVIHNGTSIWVISNDAGTSTGRFLLNTTVLSTAACPVVEMGDVDADVFSSQKTTVDFAYSDILGRSEPVQLVASLTGPVLAQLNVSLLTSQQSVITANTTAMPTRVFWVNQSAVTAGDYYGAVKDITGSGFTPFQGTPAANDYVVVGYPYLFKGFEALIPNNGTNMTIVDPQYYRTATALSSFAPNIPATIDQYGNKYGNSSTGLAWYFDPRSGSSNWASRTSLTLGGLNAINYTEPLYWIRIRIQSVDPVGSISPSWSNFRLVDYKELRIPSNQIDLGSFIDGKDPNNLYTTASGTFYNTQTGNLGTYDNYYDFMNPSEDPIINTWIYTDGVISQHLLLDTYTWHLYIEANFQVNRQRTVSWQDAQGNLNIGIVDIASLIPRLQASVSGNPVYTLNTAPLPGSDVWDSFYNFAGTYNATKRIYNPWGVNVGALISVNVSQFAWTQVAFAIYNGTVHTVYLYQIYPWSGQSAPAYLQRSLTTANETIREWGALSGTSYLYVFGGDSTNPYNPITEQGNDLVQIQLYLTQYNTPTLSMAKAATIGGGVPQSSGGTPTWVWWTIGIAGGAGIAVVTGFLIHRHRKGSFSF